MQHMQDKEFDQLIKDRFGDAELQPPVNLWERISEELEPQRKRSLPVYWWSAAAVVLVTIGIGLLTPKTEKIRLQAKADVADAGIIAKDTVRAGQVLAGRIIPAEDRNAITVSTPLIIAPRYNAAEEKNNMVPVQPNAVDARPDVERPDVISAGETQPIMDKPAVAVNDLMIASAELPADNNTEVLTEAAAQEHKGIRNVGDLVNFVVNKVDKRENKIVQFDTDDDNSSLVSLNLGIIRFSKRSNK